MGDKKKLGTLNMMFSTEEFFKFTKIQVFMTTKETLNCVRMHSSVVEIGQNAVGSVHLYF